MQTHVARLSVVIFAARESVVTLTDCVRASLIACSDKCAMVDVIINGNRALADAFLQAAKRLISPGANTIVRVWFLYLGDKAHAWNQYVHHIWAGSNTAYFVDGYAEVRPDALDLIEIALHETAEALGASGVPTSGRSASALRRIQIEENGLHGNLYAIRGTVMFDLKRHEFHLPLGLYRTDSLIGAVLKFHLDPVKYKWEEKRTLVHAEATWHVKQELWWKPRNLLGHLKRRVKQAQGALENRAYQQHLSLKRLAPESLSRTVNDMVKIWLSENQAEARRLFCSQPLTFYAARKLREPRDWSGARKAPVLLLEIGRRIKI